MTKAKAFAPAKINLTLHVTGQRPDGYHLLDSLVVFADIGDRLWVSPADDMRLEVSGPFADGVPTDSHNLVWRAADAGGKQLQIHIEKNLPHGAGIGGGSADAAAVLRMFGASEKALSLGADVPVCLSDKPQRMRGIGEDCRPVAGVPSLHMVLFNPAVHIKTPDVFRVLERRSSPGMGALPAFGNDRAFLGWLAQQRNDLEPAACTISPRIKSAMAQLKGAELVRMTGSGATCFAIYSGPGQAEQAAAQIRRDHPDWWVQKIRTVASAD